MQHTQQHFDLKKINPDFFGQKINPDFFGICSVEHDPKRRNLEILLL